MGRGPLWSVAHEAKRARGCGRSPEWGAGKAVAGGAAPARGSGGEARRGGGRGGRRRGGGARGHCSSGAPAEAANGAGYGEPRPWRAVAGERDRKEEEDRGPHRGSVGHGAAGSGEVGEDRRGGGRGRR